MSPDKYKKAVANEVIKFYNKSPGSYFNSINDEAKNISNKMNIGDKVRTEN